MKSTMVRFDGVRCGNGSGDSTIYEVFDPPWWRLDRWFVWIFLSRKRARGTLQMFINGSPRVVRCRACNVVRETKITYPTNPPLN